MSNFSNILLLARREDLCQQNWTLANENHALPLLAHRGLPCHSDSQSRSNLPFSWVLKCTGLDPSLHHGDDLSISVTITIFYTNEKKKKTHQIDRGGDKCIKTTRALPCRTTSQRHSRLAYDFATFGAVLFASAAI
jgi:hypothetical protein